MKIQGYVREMSKNKISFISLEKARDRNLWANVIPRNQLLSFNILNIGIDYLDNIKMNRYKLGQLCEIEIHDEFAKRIGFGR